jgi:hypothetical protein
MRRTIFPLLLLAVSAWAAPSLPKDVAKPVAAGVLAAEPKLLAFDCPFLVQVYDPKDARANHVGFCLYPLTIEQGIFVATTCVGVTVEPDTKTRNPFYGKSGHWGIEGKCEPERLRKKISDPEIDRTVNPITSIRIKRKEGIRLRLLRDDYGIWDLFESRTRPVPQSR